MKPVSWALFVVELYPLLKEIARGLFVKHKGDVEAARVDLRRIRDHGEQLDEFQAEIAKRMELLRARAAERDKGTP